MNAEWVDLGLLSLRATVPSVCIGLHVVPKLHRFSERAPDFPDPFGIGPKVMLVLASAVELAACSAVILGLATRWALLPLILIPLGVHQFLPAEAVKFRGVLVYPRETAQLYFCIFLALFITGPGAYSLDRLLFH